MLLCLAKEGSLMLDLLGRAADLVSLLPDWLAYLENDVGNGRLPSSGSSAASMAIVLIM